MVPTIFAAILALPVLALGSPASDYGSSLPPCSNVNRPCSCPAGTTFKNITSYGVIGAPAADVAAVMNHCKHLSLGVSLPMLTRRQPDFNTDWTGLPPVSTTGTDDVVGATRTFNITANGTSYELTEQVPFNDLAPDLCSIPTNASLY